MQAYPSVKLYIGHAINTFNNCDRVPAEKPLKKRSIQLDVYHIKNGEDLEGLRKGCVLEDQEKKEKTTTCASEYVSPSSRLLDAWGAGRDECVP